jgi:hypothetical protein
MPHIEELKQWNEIVSTKLPKLSKSMAMVLSLYSLGMIIMQSSGLTTVSQFWAAVYGRPANSFRQRLREWNYESRAKRGKKRQEVVVTEHFADLLAWVLSWWQGEEQLALAMDASHLTQRFTVLCISVVYRGCAIPVAWAVVGGSDKGSWRPYWQNLLRQLRPAIPASWTVIVLTDRGLYAKWLFKAIRAQGWHPIMRINAQGYYKRPRHKTWQSLDRLLRPGMGIWCQQVVCFKNEAGQLACTLLAQWDAAYDEGCLFVTDLPVEQVRDYWYDLRWWIEPGFKDLKRGGLRWEQTKMTDPRRAERLWFVMAVATLRLCAAGTPEQAPYTASAFRIWRPCKPPKLSVFRLGRIQVLAALFRRDSLPVGYFAPHDWHKAPL